MARCLITGASGFIGGHLAEALVARDHEVRCLVRETSGCELLKRLGVELCVGDVTDSDSLAGPLRDIDAIFHLAGLTSAHRAQDLYQVNQEGTENVVRQAASQETRPVFINVSSVAALGPAESDRPRTTADVPSPVSNYGRSKRAGELALLEYADRVSLSIVRPGIVFGPRNRETLPIFRTIRLLRCHPVAGWHPPPLSLIHIDDLIEILIRCFDRGKRICAGDDEAGYYFACASEFPDYAEWGAMMKNSLDRPLAPNLPIPFPIPWIIAGASQLFARLTRQCTSFNIDKIRESRARSWACCDDATRNDLHFVPNISIKQRTQETAKWYLDAGWL